MNAFGTTPTAPVTVLVAAAGYGKSTLVARWGRTLPVRPVAVGDLADLADDRVLYVLEDVPAGFRLPEPVLARAELWTAARLVLTGRHRIAVPARWRGRGVVGEIGPAHLALNGARAERLLRERHRVAPDGLVGYTGGWPALLHLAGAARATGDDPQPAVTEYLVAEVLAALPGAVRRLLRTAAYLPTLDGLPAGLVEQLGALGLVRGEELVPAVGAAVRAWRPLAGPVLRETLVGAATGYQATGDHRAAVRCLLDAGAAADAARLLAVHGEGLIAGGYADLVVEGLRALPMTGNGPDDAFSAAGDGFAAPGGGPASSAPEGGPVAPGGDPDDARTPSGGTPPAPDGTPSDAGAGSVVPDGGLWLLLGEALQVTGDSDAASAVYRTLAGSAATLPARLAWRAGVVEYLRGKPRAALDYFERGTPGPDSDGAVLLGWTAAARWMLGDPDGCGRLAEEAMATATALGDDAALAAAHIAQALHRTLTGDRTARQRHYDRALRHAEAAGDVVQVTRVRANIAGSLHQEGRYADALAEVRPAVRLAERTGYAAMLALALCNRGEILVRLGYLDEADGDYTRAAALYQRMGSRKVAYALTGTANLHRLRGRTAVARAAYEEAARIAGADADLQGLLPALVGLARTAAADDPAGASAAARRALEEAGAGPGAAMAYLAVGEVALAAGDRTAAAEAARTAAEHARRHSDIAALAEALELAGDAGATPAAARRSYGEAQRTWRDAGASMDTDRVTAVLGQLPGVDATARTEGRVAAGRLAALGVSAARWSGGRGDDPVAVRTLGYFEVLVDGEPVPVSGWQSRKARDLLRLLVARRGRAVPRDELAELLWPGGDDGDRRAHRLTVALSILRTVLDPRRRVGPDWYVRGDSGGVALDLSHLDIDVEGFVDTAEHGLRLTTRDPADPAGLELLANAERSYPGDFLADEPYDDWSAPLRDYARSLFIQVERALAGAARTSGDTDGAVRALLRLLEADPYDSAAHELHIGLLTGVGRYGEAGRAFSRYATAMTALGLPADGVLAPPVAR
ncbi:BTAD domain-containing putative transcriptional regulator [Longispora sp. NPDC051575]|uniref:BTAD domain-containing putative transcriptional regulator n=1 Tax=Longispora sp. NPDC051575 TaxID=3154943 RepID=UPI003448915F